MLPMALRDRLAVVLALFMFPLSPDVAAQPEAANDPELNFERAWTMLDRTYGQFVNKRVDWDALYRVYRPHVTPETSDDELFDILTKLIRHLNDGHVWLTSADRAACSSAKSPARRKDFSYDLILSKYISGTATTALDGGFTYGWVADGIAYMYIRDFRGPEPAAMEAIDTAIAEFADADGIIVDVRNNTGGIGQVANRMADRFADCKRHFMSSAMRYGPEHDDTMPMQFHVQPRGPIQFKRSTVLLTNRATGSAAERFTLAMRVLPHVTSVGDYSAGAFSAKYRDRLPNGWSLDISYKVSVDHMGICWDGVGVMPDLYCENTPEAINAETDHALEFAIALLGSGPLKLQDESASLLHVKTSIVETFFEGLNKGGIEAAKGALDQARRGNPNDYFLDPKHCLNAADPLVFQDRAADAIPLLEFCIETYPRLAMAYGLLSAAHINNGDPESARAIVERGEAVEAWLPWERDLLNRVKAALEEDDPREPEPNEG